MNYVFMALSAICGLLMLGFAFLWYSEQQAHTRAAKKVVRLGMERDDARDQRDKLNRANQDLHEKLRTQESFYKLYVVENAALTDKIDTLTTLVKDLNAENETLQKAVSQAVIPTRPVRKPAKKEGVSEQ